VVVGGLSIVEQNGTIPTPLCEMPISRRLRLTITFTFPGCDCLPGTVDFVWNGAVWQSVTHSPGCGGDPTFGWFCYYTEGPTRFWFNDGQADTPFDFWTCNPFTVTNLGQAVIEYCNGIGGWSGDLAEVPE